MGRDGDEVAQTHYVYVHIMCVGYGKRHYYVVVLLEKIVSFVGGLLGLQMLKLWSVRKRHPLPRCWWI